MRPLGKLAQNRDNWHLESLLHRLAAAGYCRCVPDRHHVAGTMNEAYSDSFLREILGSVRTFACVGVSGNDVRPSYFVARYLSLRGYTVIPVNPNYAGKTLFGSMTYSSLEEIPDNTSVDVVDVFRRSEEVPGIVEAALKRNWPLKVVWMQIGVINRDAAETALAAGVKVIQNRCPKIEHQRLFGELRKAGFNTGIITSKL